MKKSIGAKTVLLPTPVMVIGTYDSSGKPNLMTAAWGGICCSKPPCVAVSMRPATYSHGLVIERKAFTVNLPSASMVAKADFVGIYSGRDCDKFDELGLTPVKSELVDAPVVAEFPLVLECRLVNHFDLGIHTQFIGEIMDVKVDEKLIRDDGTIDVEGMDPLIFDSSGREYRKVGPPAGKAFSIGRKEK